MGTPMDKLSSYLDRLTQKRPEISSPPPWMALLNKAAHWRVLLEKTHVEAELVEIQTSAMR